MRCKYCDKTVWETILYRINKKDMKGLFCCFSCLEKKHPKKHNELMYKINSKL